MKAIISMFILLLLISFNMFSQNTYVPDDNFEQALIDLGYDTVLDDYVLTANIVGVTTLDVAQKTISDLTGIEDFNALATFHCYDNQLSSIDVSQNLSLTGLYCHYNQLTTLDITQNTALVSLNCRTNQLSTLDVTNNTLLQQLSCNSNQLTTLDISHNTALTYLHCGINQLSSLDVSQNTAITQLYFYYNLLNSIDLSHNLALFDLSCYYNHLVSLDVSQNTALIKLLIYGNQLSSLDIRNGNNTNISGVDFQAGDNPNLTCIFVDDAVWSTANWLYIDPTSTFVETQVECDALSLDEEITEQNISIFPNPSNDIVIIQSDKAISSIVIYNILGEKVNEFFSKKIDITGLSKGSYFIQINTDDGEKFTTKLLKD